MDRLKIKSLVVEHRQRLQAGCCFIGFNNSLDKHKTMVSLKTTEFMIRVDEEEYTVDTKAFFEMNMNSFHALVCKDSFLSFRFITASPKQFDAELLKVNDTACKFQRISLSLDSNGEVQETTIKCSNCESSITNDKTISVKRVLELPSSNLDVSEWFCHRHGDEKLFDDSQNNEDSSSVNCFDEKTQQFQPRINDIFYGPFCLLINSRVLNTASFREKRKQLYCKRCLQLVGVRNGSSIKFWWESVKFNERLFFSVASSIDLIRLVIRNHLASEAFVSPIVKFIFECSLPSEEDKKVHLLIQVMEKNLQLLKINLESFKFEQQPTVKVMYLKLDHTSDDDKNTLAYWQKEIGVTNYEMSFKMFHSFCGYLQTQSELIPDNFRSNNGFQFSYIPYC